MSLSAFRLYHIMKFVPIIVMVAGCSTTQPMAGDSSVTHTVASDTSQDLATNLMNEESLAQYRSKLSDLYASYQNNIPEVFKAIATGDTTIDRDYGYRVQIISSERKSTVEKAVHEYNDWIFQQNNIPYKANAYIIFKQPYYRAHIGDFINRENAIKFEMELKRKFPGAWLVHDRINYEQTPEMVKKRQEQRMQQSSSDSTQVDSLSTQ